MPHSHFKQWLGIAILGLASQAANALVITGSFTGAQLFNDATLFGDRAASVDGTDLIIGTGSIFRGKMLEVDLVGAGVIGADATTTINVTLNSKHNNSSDSDIMLAVSDGNKVVGINKIDNLNGALELVQGNDGVAISNAVFSTLTIANQFPDVSQANFILDSASSQVQGLMGPADTGFQSLQALDFTQGLSIVLFSDHQGEDYRISGLDFSLNSTSPTTVPAPGTLLLGLLGLMALRKRRAAS